MSSAALPRASALDRAWTFVRDIEGGAQVTDNPADPGGLTKWGISQRAYPYLNIRTLTEEQARDLFRADYWDKCFCSQLPDAIAIAVADGAFNMGPHRAVRQLQQALGVEVDGVPGPATLGAARRSPASELVNQLLSRRLMFYAEGKPQFRRGWFVRVLRLKDALA